MRLAIFATMIVAAVPSVFSAGTTATIDKAEVWKSDDGRSSVVVLTVKRAASESEARAQIAGQMDAMFGHNLLLYPVEMKRATCSELPAFHIDGVSYAEVVPRACHITIAFGRAHSYFVHAFAPYGQPVPDAIEHFSLSDEPFEEASVGIDYILKNLESQMPALQKACREIIQQQKGTAAKSAETR